MAARNVAQRRAAQHIRTVDKGLHRHACARTDGLEQPCRNGIGGVFLVGAVLDHNAAVHNRVIGFIRLFRVIGVNGVAVIGRCHQAGGQHTALFACTCPQLFTDALDHFLHKGGACALLGGAAHFLVVKNRTQGDHVLVFGFADRLGAGPCALQIVQLGAGDKFVFCAPNAARLAQIQKQIACQQLLRLYPCRLGDQVFQRSGAGGLAVNRQHIDLRVQGAAIVHAAVHVDRHVRDQQKIPVDVHKAGKHTAALLHAHTACNGKRAVHPRFQNGAAIFFHIQAHIVLVAQLCDILQLHGRGIAVGCGDHKAGGLFRRHTKRHHGRAVARNIIALAGLQLPRIAFLQCDKACLLQHFCQFADCMKAAGRTLHEIHHFARNSFIHYTFSFPASWLASSVSTSTMHSISSRGINS